MGSRLSKIITRTGDKGTTAMADGSRRNKQDVRVHCLGEVDELNANLGLALSFIADSDIRQVLFSVQHDLFDIGAELCQPGRVLIQSRYVEALEDSAARFSESLPTLKEFILPGGAQPVAFLQLARTVCRRAERSLHGLNQTETLNPVTLQYLNRLSDLLFIFARYLALEMDGEEVYWCSDYSRMSCS